MLLGACRSASPADVVPAASATNTGVRGTSDAAVSRLVIPSLNVDRPISEGGTSATGVMLAPTEPFAISYYSYSGRPGRGNAVFAGHVDDRTVGQAVFWNLHRLREGDVILVRLADGSELRYGVKFNVAFDAATGPWQSLFGAQAVADGVTIYTCDGDFDPASRTYNQRRVVRAERLG